MRAPTTSWWWKLTPPSVMARVRGLPTSWKRAAKRSSRFFEVLSTTARVWARTSLCRWIGVLLERHGGQFGQEVLGQARADDEPQRL